MAAELDLRPKDDEHVRLAAVARLYGAPLRELPQDLYIPPEALEVFLEAFEGPLDLLLYLIRRSNVDILDIPMASITEQYLVYVDAMRSHNLALAADYLLMAATLLEIKSRMLLPKPPRVSDEDDAHDPRQELVRRLLEYEQIKLASERLDTLDRVERDFELVSVCVAERVVEQQPEVSLHDLQMAWLRIARRVHLTQHHMVRHEQLSVREHMSKLLRRLSCERFTAFDVLLDSEQGLAGVVVNFLAMLELVKERLVFMTQSAPMAPIYVKRIDADEHA